jgi:phosphoribosylanthranilate isomerase
MTWIKICGITNLEDGLAAVEAGADALGFVFYKKSPRSVDPEAAYTIVAKLPRNVEKVGVFVNETWDKIQATVARSGLTGIQVHADEFMENRALEEDAKSGAKPLAAKRYMVLRALDLINDQRRLDSLALSISDRRPTMEVPVVFLDSGTTQQPGGTGRAFPWEKARRVADAVKQAGFRLVVAGGLTPGNVTEAIRILQPWGVDVSSGVEAEPGKKDRKKTQAFIAAVRQFEKTT